jgi:hypothetical protein
MCQFCDIGANLDDREVRVRVGFFLSFSIKFRPTLRPIQPRVRRVAGAVSSRVKRQGRESYDSPQCDAEVKNGGATPPLPNVFVAWCYVNCRDYHMFLAS